LLADTLDRTIVPSSGVDSCRRGGVCGSARGQPSGWGLLAFQWLGCLEGIPEQLPLLPRAVGGPRRVELPLQQFLLLLLALNRLALRRARESLAPHHVRLILQPLVVVDRNPAVHLHRRLHPALRLLDDVPSLVRHLLFLSRRDVDVGALRVGESLDLRRSVRVGVHAHVREVDAGERFHPGLELVGQAGGRRRCGRVRPGLERLFFRCPLSDRGGRTRRRPTR
jgi:hypothetical protein